MRIKPTLPLAAASLIVIALFADTNAAPPKGSYKHTVAECNRVFNSCYRWCGANRRGTEEQKCKDRCIDNYANCMGERYRGTLPPGVANPGTRPPVSTSP